MLANFTPQEIEEILQQFFDVTGKRQYIGARYVPIFGRKNESSIAWDNSAPYEPLSIVLYQGNSYTSRTYVPTGIDISDTFYWALTGNYNAQVEQYRQETAQSVAQMNALSTTLRTEMTALSTSVAQTDAALRNDVSTAITNVEAYADSVTDSSRPNVVILGDSWSDLTSSTIENQTNWTSFLPDWTFHNFAKSGAGFLVGTTFPQQAQTAAADDTFSHTAVSHVLIVGGVNDVNGGYTTSTDYAAPIRDTLRTLRASFPNAEIMVLFTSTSKPSINNGTINWLATRKLYSQLKRFTELQVSGASIETSLDRVSCFVLTHCFPSESFWPDDHAYYQIHLSTDGHKWLSKVINYVITTHRTPVMCGHVDNFVDSDSGCTIHRMTYLYNQNRIRFIGQIETPAISTNGRTQIIIPDSACTASSPSTGRFLGNLTDVFPYGDGYTQPTLLELAQNTLTPCVEWGNATTLASGGRAKLLIQFYINSPNAGTHSLRLVHFNAETNNIPAMRWTFDIDRYLDALDIGSGNYELYGFSYTL